MIVNVKKLYKDLKEELRHSDEFLEAAYNRDKHLYFGCDVCDSDEDCERYSELSEEYDLVIMEKLVELLLGHDYSEDEHEKLLESDFWDTLCWKFIDKLIYDKKFKILILKTLLFERE